MNATAISPLVEQLQALRGNFPDLNFDHAAHEYWVAGKKLPFSATKILEICGVNSVEKRFYTEKSRTRGTNVHSCCHYLAENDLDWDTVSPELTPYVRDYERHVSDLNFVPVICELPAYHKIFEYGVTLDQGGLIGDKLAIVELKTGKLQPWTAIQTALQVMALFPPEDYYKVRRIGFELHGDGSHKAPFFFVDPTDFFIANAMVSTAAWKLNHGWKEAV